MAQRKFKLNKLRELHAAIGALIDESDKNMASAAAAEDDDAPSGADGPSNAHSRNRAHDSAPLEGISMAAAFPGWTANGPLRR